MDDLSRFLGPLSASEWELLERYVDGVGERHGLPKFLRYGMSTHISDTGYEIRIGDRVLESGLFSKPEVKDE